MQALVKEERTFAAPQTIEAMPVKSNPEEVIAMGQKMAYALKKVLQQNNWTVKIGPSEHLRFEAWQTLGSFFGFVPTVLSVEPMMHKDRVVGYICWAGVKRIGDDEDRIVCKAMASCSRDEPNWKNKPDFQLRSMAQTRACAKALRQFLSWIVALAGYDPTPAEELEDVANGTAANGKKRDPEEVKRTRIAKEIKALQERLGLSDAQLVVHCHGAGFTQVKTKEDLRNLTAEQLAAIRDRLKEKLEAKEAGNGSL